jgi:hypothetical protein
MLPNTLDQVRSYPDIQSAVSLVGQQVYAGLLDDTGPPNSIYLQGQTDSSEPLKIRQVFLSIQ